MNFVIKAFFCTYLAMILILCFVGFAHILDLLGALRGVVEFGKTLWTLLKDIIAMLGSVATALTLVYLVIDSNLRRLLDANNLVFEKYLNTLSMSNIILANTSIQKQRGMWHRSKKTLLDTSLIQVIPQQFFSRLIEQHFKNQRLRYESVLRTEFFPNIKIANFLGSGEIGSIPIPKELIEQFLPMSTPFSINRERLVKNIMQVCHWFSVRRKSPLAVNIFGDGLFIGAEEISFWDTLKELLEDEDHAYSYPRNLQQTVEYLEGKNYYDLAAIYFFIENKELRITVSNWIDNQRQS